MEEKMKNLFAALAIMTGLMLAVPYVATADVAEGEAIVMKKCKGCHAFGKAKMGPDLDGIGKRTDAAWLKSWLTDTGGTWAANEGYTATLRAAVGDKGPKHKTPKLDDAQINSIVEFLMTK